MSSPKAFEATAEALDFSITKLRTGLFLNLYNLYSQTYGDEAKYLCGAILNNVLVEEPTNEAAKRYKDEKSELIRNELANLHLHSETSKALSYLYAAQILYLNLSAFSGNKHAGAKIPELTRRATEAHVMIPDTYEICGKGDAYSCAKVLADICEDVLRSEPGKGSVFTVRLPASAES
jgi:hypothetical protein